MTEEAVGGRIFFSSRGRDIIEEDEIRLLSVGVDIGSSTTHLVFSRLVLERLDSRYVVAERALLHRSEILLTPYGEDDTIDAAALGAFIAREYAAAGVEPDAIDTGALVLTGVAVRRQNARAVGDLFSAQAGKMVAVSAGDSLETVMAAFGSGAVARSLREQRTVVNVDIGGGTSKIAVCRDGEVVDRTAIDIGARIVVTDDHGMIVRVEEAGRWFARDLGLDLEVGRRLTGEAEGALVRRMVELLFMAIDKPGSELIQPLLRLSPLAGSHRGEVLTVSGGVSEYVYGAEARRFGDLGPMLALEVRRRAEGAGLELSAPDEGIRATVIGASQYTTQVSGGTVYVDPMETLPIRNVPVIAPTLPMGETIEPEAVAEPIRRALEQMELVGGDSAVALFVRWDGSASFARLDGFCRGVLAGLAPVLTDGRPVVLAGDNDVGGLIGIHLRAELNHPGAVISIDGLDLKAFDFIDIGQLLADSGAAPVVIKSLVFPTDAGLGRPKLV